MAAIWGGFGAGFWEPGPETEAPCLLLAAFVTVDFFYPLAVSSSCKYMWTIFIACFFIYCENLFCGNILLMAALALLTSADCFVLLLVPLFCDFCSGFWPFKFLILFINLSLTCSFYSEFKL